MQRKYILASAGAYRGALRQIGSDGRPTESRGFARRSEFRVSALLHSYGVLEGLACTVHDDQLGHGSTNPWLGGLFGGFAGC